jgi:hypothetical protein
MSFSSLALRAGKSCWIACVALMGIVLPARAQDEPRPYVRFEIKPDFEKTLKDRLQSEKQLGPLKDLIKQIAADPSKFHVDPAKLTQFDLKDDKFKKALQDWVASDPQLKKALSDWVRQMPPDKRPANVKQFTENLEKILDQPPKKIDLPPAPIEPAKPRIEPKADPLAKATERAMTRAQDSKLGDWLSGSPAWKRAFEDLRTSINNPSASRMRLGNLPDKLRLSNDGAWKLGAGTLEGLRKLPRPDLARFSPSLPSFGSLSTPNLAVPGMPGIASPFLPSISTGATWLLLALLCLLVGWQMLRWTKRPDVAVDERAGLGPWPVRPEAVTTRAELVQAFDYLALRTLGLGAQSWNHHAVARSWRERLPRCAEPAQALALLYEQARYTDGAEALTEAERDQARRSLLVLAEAL